jgi:hypothetical protein
VKRILGNDRQAAKIFALLLAAMLGLALFLSPYRLHSSPTSIFFVSQTAASEHAGHSEHEHQQTQELQCLRCVLYGFQLPETATPFVIILVVLGFIKVAKPIAPDSFITLSKTARAPPVSL